MRHKVVKQVASWSTGAEWRKFREAAEVQGSCERHLAQTMGASPPYVSDPERGRRNWSDEVENKYASALRVDKAIAQECTCHERDGSHACPACRPMARGNTATRHLRQTKRHTRASSRAGTPGHTRATTRPPGQGNLTGH